MTIAEAKEEIRNTVRAYLATDDTGNLLIPREKQRPVLLMGPPGIGKTAIMEQVAQELHVNLVSYTITHHTRQSAIGLPFISKRKYDNKEYSVTEYTMSEIIASVYDKIALSGVSEGILFLDEINCVSETLVPTMLQFLQYKTFGAHEVPQGFVIVTAGNPPEYNNSVRDFDVVTLDRVRRMDVEASYDAWKPYALSNGMHGSVLAYLEIHKNHFYSMRTEADGRHFVTARGWEDLSRLIAANEALSINVNETLCVQFLQDADIARSFALYYALWQKYKDLYDVEKILAGEMPSGETKKTLQRAPFDEKLSVLTLLQTALSGSFARFSVQLEAAKRLRDALLLVTEDASPAEDAASEIAEAAHALKAAGKKQADANLISRREAQIRQDVADALFSFAEALRLEESADEETTENYLRARFAKREEERLAGAEKTDARLTNAFSFLEETFGEGQEMVLFLTALIKNEDAVCFVNEYGNEAYFRYNRRLLLDENRRELAREALSLMS